MQQCMAFFMPDIEKPCLCRLDGTHFDAVKFFSIVISCCTSIEKM